MRKEIKAAKKRARYLPLPQSTVLVQRPPIAPELEPACEQIEALFKKYGVTNEQDLIEAINKPLMDSIGVKTFAELMDTLPKLRSQAIEASYANKKVAFEDFKYYIFNTSRLGWANCDRFSDYPENSLTNLRVNLDVADNIDCKLVFVEEQLVVPVYTQGKKYVFENVPKGKLVWVVALKYEDYKPYLSMQKTTIEDKTCEVDFRLLTLEELKTELKKLDGR